MDMYFNIDNETQSKQLQEVLFAQGYRWRHGAGQEVSLTDKEVIITRDTGHSSPEIGKTISWCAGSLDGAVVGNTCISATVMDTDDFIRKYCKAAALPSLAKEAPPMPECKPPKTEPVISDGGSSSYYKLTITNKAGESIECVTGDVLRALVGNDYDLSNIVKACRRSYEASQGRGKAGATIQYDMNKVKYFADEYAHWHQE